MSMSVGCFQFALGTVGVSMVVISVLNVWSWFTCLIKIAIMICRQASLKVARRSVRATFNKIKNFDKPILGSGPFPVPALG